MTEITTETSEIVEYQSKELESHWKNSVKS